MKIRFSSQHKLGSWLIRKVTRSEWSHVEFILEDGRTLGSRFFGGVQIRKPLTKLRTVCDVEIPWEPGWIEELYEYIGDGYDYLGAIGWLYNRVWQKLGRWTCSELVADFLQRKKLIDVGLSSSVEPRLLYFILTNRL